MSTCLENLKIGNGIAVERSIDRTHDNRSTVDTHKLEKCDRAFDKRHARIGVNRGEQRRDESGYQIGERHSKQLAARKIDKSARKDRKPKCKDIAKTLRNRARDLFGELDRHIMANAHLIDINGQECGYERSEKTLGSHIAGFKNRCICSANRDNIVRHR